MFQAFYENAKKAKAVATANGWDGQDGRLDYIDGREFDIRTCKTFARKIAAIEWLQSEINALKTVYGVGEIAEIEQVTLSERCRYCTCRGNKQTRRYVVSDAGIETDEAVDDCADDD